MTDHKGQILGPFQQYQLVERQLLSYARESELYRAYDLIKQVYVAVHLLPDQVSSNGHFGGFRSHFETVMKRTLQVDDANLIRVLDYEATPNVSYIVTPWFDGWLVSQALAQLGPNRWLDFTQAIEIVQQVGCAIETAHLNHLPIRAITPSTILLVSAGREVNAPFWAILTDLGLTSLIGDRQIPLEQRSNEELLYMAPEQLAGQPPDMAGNVYALGVLLYQLIMGRPPFVINTHEDAKSYKDQSVLAPRTQYPTLPPPLEQVMLTALAKNPQQRYARASILVAALARALAFLNSETITAISDQQIRLAELFPDALIRDISLRQSITIDKPRIKLVPGGVQEKATLTVFNRTNQVERFTLQFAPHDFFPGCEASLVAQNDGRAEIDQFARFELTLWLSQGAHPLAQAYPIMVTAHSHVRGAAIGQLPIHIIVERALQYQVEEIWPQVIRAQEQAAILVRNWGNVRETFLFTWRSENNEIDFDQRGAVAIVAPNEEQVVEFRPFPRRTPWFGRDKTMKITAQVVVKNAAKLELRKAEVKVRSLFPPLTLLMVTLTLLGCLLLVVWSEKPHIVVDGDAADACRNLASDKFPGPALATCWSKNDRKNVKSLALLLNARENEIPITQTWGITTFVAATATSSNTTTIFTPTASLTNAHWLAYVYQAADVGSRVDRPQLVARNRLGEQRWLGPISWLGTSYYNVPYQQILPKPQVSPLDPQIIEFCVASDGPQSKSSCSPTSLALSVGEARTLTFYWQDKDIVGGQPIIDPPPTQIDQTAKRATSAVPATAGNFLFTLTLLDDVGQIKATKLVTVSITAITYTTQISLALRQAPGDIYVSLGTLVTDTQIILASKPTDYAQNSDSKCWAKVIVAATEEQGWVDVAYLKPAGASNDDGLACNETPNSDAEPAGSSVASTNGNATGANGSAANEENGNPVADLPVANPEPGPTVTPIPTPTPMPTPTPQPTKEPPRIDIQMDKLVIEPKECVHIRWTIVGVVEVRFDNGTGELQPSNDNVDRTIERCDLKRTTVFRWQIIVDLDGDHDDKVANEELSADDIVRIEERTVEVKARPDE